MPSPFPGMDPYIEHPEVWSDFSASCPVEVRSELNRVLTPHYVARITAHETSEMVEVDGQSLISPVRLYEVEILHAKTMKLTAVVKLLSPVEKTTSHREHDDYLRKRQELLRSSAHLLEIDLLRIGKRPPLERPVPEAPYYVTLSRANRRPYVEVWPIQLADSLPLLPVPLLAPDPDVPLDLGKAVAACYERGGYDVIINYTRDVPPPKLAKEDELWLDQLLRTKSLR